MKKKKLSPIQELAKLMAEREGKLKEVSMGNIRECVGILSDLIVEKPSYLKALLDNGIKRSKKK